MEGFVNPFKGEVATPPASRRARFRRFRERSRKGILLLCWLLVLVLPVTFVAARPSYSRFKDWRAERLTLEAESMVEAENWDGALNTASAAYLLAPQTPRTVRLVARVLSHFNSERAFDFWQVAVALEPEREEQRRTLIDQALRYQQLQVAERNAAELLQRHPDDRANILIAARTARASRDYTREYRLLNRARTLWPEDAEIQFRLNRVLTMVGNEGEIRLAVAGLREDARRKDQVGLDALEYLLTRPAADFPDRSKLAQLFREHPEAAGPQLVAACALEVDAQPAERTRRLDELVRLVATRDATTKLAAADWLLRIGEIERTLKLFPWEEVHSSPKLVLAHLDALSRTGDRAALDRLLATPALPLRKEFAHLFRWQALRAADPTGAHDREAVAAVDAAIAFPPSLVYVALRFEEFGRTELATQAFSRLSHVPKFRATALSSLLRIAQRERDTNGILDLLERARAEGMADPAAQAEIAYYELLLKRNVQKNRQMLAQLTEEHPDRMMFVSTLALACLRDEDFADALKTFERRDFRWRRASSAVKAVYAATLQATGRPSQAREVMREVSPDALLPEERALLGTMREWIDSNGRP
jgi:hypothetical protein